MKFTIIIKWVVLASIIGILAGSASAVFLYGLDWVSNQRASHPQLLWGLPIVGLFMGWSYQKFGANAGLGNHLVISEANERQGRIPLRMAPMVLAGTLLTHLFGGSAGREGTAIQMGASLADSLKRILHLPAQDHRLVIMAGISGGFGSVFGVPIAGFIFGLEVLKMGRLRYNALIPCLTASLIGDYTTRALGAPHGLYPTLPRIDLDLILVLKVGFAGLCFGLAAILFIEGIRLFKKLWSQIYQAKWTHPAMGGVLIIVLATIFGPQYLGLSLDLIHQSIHAETIPWYASAVKLIFTVVTLSAGFLGGEVTPLFVIGSTLGNSLSEILLVDPTLLACIGLVAVFAGASNTPLACAIMGLELFGGGAIIYLFIGCFIAFLTSGHRGIYSTQRLWVDKYDPTLGPTKEFF